NQAIEAAQRVTGATVSAWLRALAQRAEADPAFAAQLATALAESGLAGQPLRASKGRRASTASAAAPAPETPAPPDPFSVYRAQGEAGLRATLETLDLATLRIIVRTHRLDPARISARWTARDRVIRLIVEQVRARANHGRAFERI
ncbi:MAG: hypothetical protein KGO05_15670, partial [Chloroflexota bacterium]|nr:hypothetical protein [Chloroflexota bacterium]